MSAIATFSEGEPAVGSGVSCERAQELDNVVSRYLPMFYKRAFRFLGNATDAEDAVQDALLSAYKHLGQFRGQAQLSTWLTPLSPTLRECNYAAAVATCRLTKSRGKTVLHSRNS